MCVCASLGESRLADRFNPVFKDSVFAIQIFSRLQIMNHRATRFLPILDWGRTYTKATLAKDSMAGLIVAIMLVPQGMAYALLAGLPAEVGLDAGIVPLVFCGLLGASRALAVGLVASV